jgi:pyridoxine 5-phosphate synthase
MKRLGVNIDHIATVRNARGENHPNVISAAKFVIKCGADLVTIHLREDRRHINDTDLKILSNIRSIPINLEIAANNQMLKIALKHKPKYVCIVPEKRSEVTTEGGLNLRKHKNKLKKIVKKLKEKKIRSSLFINPNIEDIEISKFINTNCVEIHTGKISRQIKAKRSFKHELRKIIECTDLAVDLGIEVHAGHGIDFKTAKVLSKIKEIKEFNIGHFIIGESIFYGLNNIIKIFKKICR